MIRRNFRATRLPKQVPQGILGIDQNHPSSSGLRFFYIPGNQKGLFNLAGGNTFLNQQAYTGTIGGVYSTPIGNAITSLAGNGGGANGVLLPSQLISGDISLMYFGFWTNNSNNSHIIGIDTTTVAEPYSALAIEDSFLILGNGTAHQTITPGLSSASSAPTCIILSWNSAASTIDVWQNGILNGTYATTYPGPGYGSNTYALMLGGNRVGSSGNGSTSKCLAAGFWNRTLNATDVALLTQDPFGLARSIPARRSSVAAPSVSASGIGSGSSVVTGISASLASSAGIANSNNLVSGFAQYLISAAGLSLTTGLSSGVGSSFSFLAGSSVTSGIASGFAISGSTASTVGLVQAYGSALGVAPPRKRAMPMFTIIT